MSAPAARRAPRAREVASVAKRDETEPQAEVGEPIVTELCRVPDETRRGLVRLRGPPEREESPRANLERAGLSAAVAARARPRERVVRELERRGRPRG